jgi:pilus assembly protein Flp/PilA
MIRQLKSLLREEKGQAMTEYGLILALIAIVVIAVLTTMGTSISDKFQEIVNNL